MDDEEMKMRVARAQSAAREDALAEVCWGLELLAKAMRQMHWEQADGVELAAQWVKTVAEAES